MSWTYSGDPSISDLDAVRFLVGDTDSSDPQISNEEITFLLAQEGNTYKAAAGAAKSIMAKYARLADKSVGDLSISYSQRQAAYEKLAESLTTSASMRSAVPLAGGISVADKLVQEQDPDRVKPVFFRGQFDEPGVPPGDNPQPQSQE